eukprot:scaffold62109_cov54-Phaeocystis_antarctica.AAC.3
MEATRSLSASKPSACSRALMEATASHSTTSLASSAKASASPSTYASSTSHASVKRHSDRHLAGKPQRREVDLAMPQLVVRPEEDVEAVLIVDGELEWRREQVRERPPTAVDLVEAAELEALVPLGVERLVEGGGLLLPIGDGELAVGVGIVRIAVPRRVVCGLERRAAVQVHAQHAVASQLVL